MRGSSRLVAAIILLGATVACGAGPTEQEIVDSLEGTIRSVAGDWRGTSNAENPITLEFRLQEGSDGQVTGTGSMKEAGAATAVPITVAGTYRRPVLALTFSGMRYEGRQVQGTAQGDYTTVGGISTTLQLTAPSYSKAMPVLLQEQ